MGDTVLPGEMPVEKSPANHLTDPAFLADLRRQMLKFAVLQLDNEAQAEDAVQEALVGALKNVASFERKAALKTWVFAILKHKITDLLRYRQRWVDVEKHRELPDEESLPSVFDTRGFWHQDDRPNRWAQPVEAIDDAHFWRVFEACLEDLPPAQGRVFMMREFIELDSDEICQSVDITTSNLHVLLHRARLRLRRCLEMHWFCEDEAL
ncbi:RNA polymerase factor sigma-70 [Saccharospirillum impatiens]|uniref:RNA polymerase factor sigma-70 n=1 Tax=Saccharospirillum impatiens TaxID=169438 RepID=UPI000404C149|nr:RNA polymerase factor sigma-70 [Saccharospirillum impatiens]